MIGIMRTRLLSALAATTLLAALGLTGCASQSTDPACISVSNGKVSDSIKVAGEFGGKATVTAPANLTVDALQRSILTKGTGVQPKPGQTVNAMVSFFAGGNADPLQAKVAELPIGDSRMTDALRAGIDCLPVGTRSVAVVPASELLTAQEMASLKMNDNEAMIVVVDIIEVVPDPTVTPWSNGVPKVSFDSAGKPTIDVATGTKPDGIGVSVIKEGSGQTVRATDTVSVHYLGVFWDGGKSFDGNFGADATDLTLTAVIPGFKAGLTGQKVGATVLLSIPAKYAYGEGTPTTQNQMAGQDLLFLVEINGVTAPTSK